MNANLLEKLFNYVNDSADEFKQLVVVCHPKTHNFLAQAQWLTFSIEGSYAGTVNEALESLTRAVDNYK